MPAVFRWTIPRVWRSDIYQTRLEDLAPARALRGTFSYNEDYVTKRQASIEVSNPDALEPLGDWILAELERTSCLWHPASPYSCIRDVETFL